MKKARLNELESYDRFLDEIAAVFGVPRRELDRLIAPFQQEPIDIEKSTRKKKKSAPATNRRSMSSRAIVG